MANCPKCGESHPDGVVLVSIPPESAHLYAAALDQPFTREDFEAALRKVARRSEPRPTIPVTYPRPERTIRSHPLPRPKRSATPYGGRGKGDAEQRLVERVRAKAAAHEALTRDERHLLQREYRHRERTSG